jgi:hypothetical protein
MKLIPLLTLTALLLAALAGLNATSAPAAKPNIIFILADDLGYGDVGCYNKDSKIPCRSTLFRSG